MFPYHPTPKKRFNCCRALLSVQLHGQLLRRSTEPVGLVQPVAAAAAFGETRKTMSSLTTEYMIKIGENSIRYDVLIGDFLKKIDQSANNALSVGKQRSFCRKIKTSARRSIHSRVFKIGQSKFQIKIYPNGDTVASKGTVGVFVENKSDWRVKVEVNFFSAQRYLGNGKVEGSYVDVGENVGFSSFINHVNDCAYGTPGEGTFELQTTITLLEEQVTAERDMSGMNEGIKEALDYQGQKLSSKVDNMKEEMVEMRADIRGIKDKVTDLQKQQRKEMTAVQRGIAELKLCMTGVNTNGQPEQQEARRIFECPMCTEEARPPMRLKQCGEGHIICDSCYARDDEARRRDGRETRQCGVCREPITGRPTALETLLGLN